MAYPSRAPAGSRCTAAQWVFRIARPQSRATEYIISASPLRVSQDWGPRAAKPARAEHYRKQRFLSKPKTAAEAHALIEARIVRRFAPRVRGLLFPEGDTL